MKTKQVTPFLFTLFLFAAFQVDAVITRHDVAPERYKMASAPEFFIDMPFQGAAVLIDRQWLLAPAHVIYTFMYEYQNKPINIQGVENRIAEVILHPEYERVGGSSDNGEDSSLIEQLSAGKDIALIRLENPVNHIAPIAIYGGANEKGMEVTGFGRGAVGTGLTGEVKDSQGPGFFVYYWWHVTKFFSDWAFTQEDYQLQRYSNQITNTSEQWLKFIFDRGKEALPLEGTIGSGDSGGAVITIQNDTPILVGLASWREFEGDVHDYEFGHYGDVAVLTRVSYFKEWITRHVKNANVILE